jgi:hypothetical protein
MNTTCTVHFLLRSVLCPFQYTRLQGNDFYLNYFSEVHNSYSFEFSRIGFRPVDTIVWRWRWSIVWKCEQDAVTVTAVTTYSSMSLLKTLVEAVSAWNITISLVYRNIHLRRNCSFGNWFRSNYFSENNKYVMIRLNTNYFRFHPRWTLAQLPFSVAEMFWIFVWSSMGHWLKEQTATAPYRHVNVREQLMRIRESRNSMSLGSDERSRRSSFYVAKMPCIYVDII